VEKALRSITEAAFTVEVERVCLLQEAPPEKDWRVHNGFMMTKNDPHGVRAVLTGQL
jgi:hypothetical protein